jgi:hypothetical protein
MLERKRQLKAVFEKYSEDVLKESKCPFIKTLLSKGISSGAQIDKYFRELLQPPESLAGKLRIEKFDHGEVNEEIEKGRRDDATKCKLNEIYRNRLGEDKRIKPLAHDSGLLHGVKYLLKEYKAWILTTDSTLTRYARVEKKHDEFEICVNLDVLIALFAIDGGGVEFSAIDFAPLFKNLVLNSFTPDSDTFDVRDLTFMLNVQLNIEQLTPEKISSLAEEVHSQRVNGKSNGDIALFLRREIEGVKMSELKDADRARRSEKLAVAKADALEVKNRAYREVLIENEARKLKCSALLKFIGNIICCFIVVSTVPLILSVLVMVYAAEESTNGDLYAILAIALSIVLPLVNRVPEQNKKYRDLLSSTRERAISKIDQVPGNYD